MKKSEKQTWKDNQNEFLDSFGLAPQNNKQKNNQDDLRATFFGPVKKVNKTATQETDFLTQSRNQQDDFLDSFGINKNEKKGKSVSLFDRLNFDNSEIENYQTVSQNKEQNVTSNNQNQATLFDQLDLANDNDKSYHYQSKPIIDEQAKSLEQPTENIVSFETVAIKQIEEPPKRQTPQTEENFIKQHQSNQDDFLSSFGFKGNEKRKQATIVNNRSEKVSRRQPEAYNDYLNFDAYLNLYGYREKTKKQSWVKKAFGSFRFSSKR